MRCLIAAVLIATMACATVLVTYQHFGWWGVLSMPIVLWMLMWVASRLLPMASRAWFTGALSQLAGPMVDAEIIVHSVTLADEPDCVPDLLRRFERFVDEFQDEDVGCFHIEVDEFLGHCEERLEEKRYEVDITVTPPENAPEAAWAPDAISLRSPDPGNLASCTVYDVAEFDESSQSFRKSRTLGLQEIRGKRRIRLHLSLDPGIRIWQFEYGFVNPLNATLEIPESVDDNPLLRFARGALHHALTRNPLQTLSLSHMPISDDDVRLIDRHCGLRFLGLEHTQVTDGCLSHVATIDTLQQLSLDGTAISDEGLKQLVVLTELQRIFLRGTTLVTQNGRAHLQQAIPSLKILS